MEQRMSKLKQSQGAAADIKSAISTLSDVYGAESIVQSLRHSLAATKMLMHTEWSERKVWVSYPNGFLATIVEIPQEPGVSYTWYLRPTGLVNEQYGLPSNFNCGSCGPDMKYVRQGYAKSFGGAKEKVLEVAEELLELRSQNGIAEAKE